MKTPRTIRFLVLKLCLISIGLLAVVPASAAECWQGWGYLVEPKTLAFKSEQSLYVTDGPVEWDQKHWISLYPVDSKTGRRIRNAQPVLIRPSRPFQKGAGNWGSIIEDVAEVNGSRWSMMLRLSHVAPSEHSRTLNDEFSRWACGLE